MISSKYVYPNTDVLRNKLNIKDNDTLEKAERQLTTIRHMELIDSPIADGNWNLKHLQRIHKHLFQDVYDFAGKIREEQIAKGTFQFASPLYIKDMSDDLFKGLRKENFLKGLDKQNMSDRLAHYMAEINVLHPFREGNGRTQREFIRTLGMSNGYTVDWTRIDKDEFMKASITSVFDPKDLSKVIYDSIVENEASKEVLQEWKKHENDMELE